MPNQKSPKQTLTSYRYCVITEVPSPSESGNLYDAPIYKLGNQLYVDVFLADDTPVAFAKALGFTVGELLIIDGNGREINGRGRKPSEWHVGYEVYHCIEPAVDRAIQITRYWERVIGAKDNEAPEPFPGPLIEPVETRTSSEQRARTEAIVKAIRDAPISIDPNSDSPQSGIGRPVPPAASDPGAPLCKCGEPAIQGTLDHDRDKWYCPRPGCPFAHWLCQCEPAPPRSEGKCGYCGRLPDDHPHSDCPFLRDAEYECAGTGQREG